MRFCVMCSSQFEPKTPYATTCSDECDRALEAEAREIAPGIFADVSQTAAENLGFKTVEDAQQWLGDLRRSDTNPQGEIYFLHCGLGDEDFVKIGYSKDIVGRIETLQPGTPIDLELVGRMPGTIQMEQAIHKHFSHLRKRGEWFHFTDELWDFVKATTRNECQ